MAQFELLCVIISVSLSVSTASSSISPTMTPTLSLEKEAEDNSRYKTLEANATLLKLLVDNKDGVSSFEERRGVACSEFAVNIALALSDLSIVDNT